MSYFDRLTEAMMMLYTDERVVFLGQGVDAEGTFMSHTLKHIPNHARLEMPVAENMQMGMSIGMALNGVIPVSIFPRWNFLISAADQLVNHLDKFQPHVIVRVGVGSETPLYPGDQHVGNFSEAFRQMMPNTHIVELHNEEEILDEYRNALKRNGPTIVVEFADKY